MVRLLVWLILGFIGSVFMRSFVRALFGVGGRTPRPAAPGRTGTRAEPLAEQLVRDRVCDTFLPRSRALREVDASGHEYFFCSEECRRKHLETNA